MSDKMRGIPLKSMIEWIFYEYNKRKTIFGIPESKFFWESGSKQGSFFGHKLGVPLGPAAGPHTQLAQNIVAAFLCGSRFIELKTVQVMDNLEFPKPCILAVDEAYNTEWSTELAIEEACQEYIKAWYILHILQKELFGVQETSLVFNMSVGYDLEGIKTPKVNNFIEGLKDASDSEFFHDCKAVLKGNTGLFKAVDEQYIDNISPNICNLITLSTLHGCPPEEIEAISRYLLAEKQLDTLIKMNPTLLGYQFAREVLNKTGYDYINLSEKSFTEDLQYDDGMAMLKRLISFSREKSRNFGIKLSNTLPVKITRKELPGEEMYMSGRALYALTINLASKIANEFEGLLPISYSGGADFFNIASIFETGIQPITVATTLLKNGGYLRLKQLATEVDKIGQVGQEINQQKLTALAAQSLTYQHYQKKDAGVITRKIPRELPLFDCFTSPCSQGCPIKQDVPGYSRLVAEKKFDNAFRLIISENPLPFITGNICNQPCMSKCTRLSYDQSVCIRDIKIEAAEKGWDSFISNPHSHLNRRSSNHPARVAVIGSGPSGLTAAYFLSLAGFNVTVFDKRKEPGGMVSHIIPPFRISRDFIKKDITLIEQAGVKFVKGFNPDFSLKELQNEGFEYIYLAIGAEKSHSLQLDIGHNNVMAAVDFLEKYNSGAYLNIGEHVVIIGGGNTAIDSARAAVRLKGVKNVDIIYRRTIDYMPADRDEVDMALEEGVAIYELLLPISCSGNLLHCTPMQLGAYEQSGRRSVSVKKGSLQEFKADFVIAAIGETVDEDILKKNGVVVTPGSNKTNIANVFIGGDALSGPSSIVEAMAHGKKVAQEIITAENNEQVLEIMTGKTGTPEGHLDQIILRKGVLQEPLEDMLKEAKRCLECNSLCNICVEVCPNRANFAAILDVEGLGNYNQIVHLDGMCNECGNCATFCPYDGAPYKDKLTLFWNEDDFANSQNDGLLLMQNDGEVCFKIRFNNNTTLLKLHDAIGVNNNLSPEFKEAIQSLYENNPYLFQNIG